MANILSQFIRYVFLILGFYEMFMVYRGLTEDPISLQAEMGIFPSSFYQVPVKYLFTMFPFYLGCIRLMWVTSDNSFPTWLTMVFAHLAECVFLWSLAFQHSFHRSRNITLATLIPKVASLEVGNVNSRLVLFIVPVLVLLLLVHGPGDSRSSAQKKKMQ